MEGDEIVTVPLAYTISMARANSHYFGVALRINLPGPSSGPMNLMMAVWTPGHYSIDDFPKYVLNVSAKKRRSDSGWEEAFVQKETKNVWRINWSGSTDAVQVDYSVYAFEYQDTKS